MCMQTREKIDYTNQGWATHDAPITLACIQLSTTAVY